MAKRNTNNPKKRVDEGVESPEESGSAVNGGAQTGEDVAAAGSSSQQGQADPSINVAPTGDDGGYALTSDTDGEFFKLPRVVSVEIVKLPEKAASGTRKKRAGPRSKTMQPSALSVPFGTVRPHAGSPPPPKKTNAAAGGDPTEDEEQARMSVAASDADTEGVQPLETSDTDVSLRSTASGAYKRVRRTPHELSCGKRKTLGGEEDADGGAVSLSSSEEDPDPEEERTRKRGRPVVTGKGVASLAIQERARELRSLEEEVRTMRKIAEGGYDPSDFKGKSRSKMAERLQQEANELPLSALAGEILQAVKRIEEVAVKSKNLKGGFIRVLRESALKIEVSADIMTQKALPANGSGGQEVERLRAEVSCLREELARLRADKEESRPALDQASMDVEVDPPAVILPPRREWPPAVRPALRGVRKVLEDSEEESGKAGGKKEKATPPPPAKERKPTSPQDLENLVERKLSKFAEKMREELRDTLSSLLGKSHPPPPVPAGARVDAPAAPTPKGSKAGRPVPERSQEGKRTVRKEGKREPAKASSSSLAPPSVKQTVAGKGAAKTAPETSQGAKVPEKASSRPTETWAQVVGRKERRRAGRQPEPVAPPSMKKGEESKKGGKPAAKGIASPSVKPVAQSKGQGKKAKRRVPKTSAIVLSSPGEDYDKLMAEVRGKVSLQEVGITEKIKIRSTITGAILIEVPGSESGCKADALAGRMREVLREKRDVKISRPSISAEVRVWPLEPSITKAEVVEAVSGKCACLPREIQAGEIRPFARNMGSLWLRMPLALAKKAAEGGVLEIGWTKVKVVLLDPRPLRCYKCLERGHTRETCPSKSDRSDRCYRCGGSGHLSRECNASPRCPICADIGRKADHVLGGKSCTTQNRKGKAVGGNKGGSPPPPATTAGTPMEVDAVPSTSTARRGGSLEEGNSRAN